jgi:hypothetical protein
VTAPGRDILETAMSVCSCARFLRRFGSEIGMHVHRRLFGSECTWSCMKFYCTSASSIIMTSIRPKSMFSPAFWSKRNHHHRIDIFTLNTNILLGRPRMCPLSDPEHFVPNRPRKSHRACLLCPGVCARVGDLLAAGIVRLLASLLTVVTTEDASRYLIMFFSRLINYDDIHSSSFLLPNYLYKMLF